MDRIKYLEAKIKLIEDAIKEDYSQNKAISEAGQYWAVIKNDLKTDSIASFISDGSFQWYDKQKVLQYLDRERMKYNELKENRKRIGKATKLSIAALIVSLLTPLLQYLLELILKKG